jgi:hypothetical protein
MSAVPSLTNADYPEFGLSAAQRREAVLAHRYERPGMDGARGEIWCYSDALAYAPGSRVRLQINSSAARAEMEIARDGADLRVVMKRSLSGLRWQSTPENCSIDGCGWATSLEFEVGEDWPSGAYRVTLTAEGNDGAPIRAHHLFFVKPRFGAKPGRILQVASTGTWTAYNTWGGSSHYRGLTGPNRDQYSPTVSLERPWARGFIVLPPDAPRVPLEFSPPPGAPLRYPHLEWAYATGHSNKYASAGWASYDSHFMRWAERAGYAVDLVSQHELQFEPDLLHGYDCIVMVGHDEYWSWEMRDAVDDYVERGGRVARFAGNFMWQTRLEADGRRQVCYKYRARAEDPVYRSSDRTRTTGCWEAPETTRPGAATFGLNATDGLYAGWGSCGARGVRGFPVYRPEHWAFTGTGLGYGDLLGHEGHAFGYEVDGLPYVIRDCMPEALPSGGAPAGISILALGMATLREEPPPPGSPDDRFIGNDEAAYVAELRFGDSSETSIDRIKRGAGMIVHFSRGAGEVFHAGSCEWVAALLRADLMVDRVTRNVLDRYCARR